MLVLIVFVVAFACEARGLTLAYLGMKETWHVHGPPGKRLWSETVEPYARALRRTRDKFRRRRGVTIQVPGIAVGTAVGNATVTGNASAIVSSVLPDPEVDLAGFGQKVGERIHALSANLDKVSEAVSVEKRERERVVREVRDDLSDNVADTKRLTRSIAVDGLPLQMRGWLWVFVGIVLGSLAQIGQQIVMLRWF